jgi:hypothetical protein
MRRATVILGSLLLVTPVHANELWSYQTKSNAAKQPMLSTFEIIGKELIQTWATGIQATYEVTQNNAYGLVGLSSISALEPNQTAPTVGASAVVIHKPKKEVWLATVIAGQQSIVNDLSHGTCIQTGAN